MNRLGALRLTGFVSALLGVTIGLASCAGSGLRECPEFWADSTFIPAVARTINIPEFHDCQRFVVKGKLNKLVFDSLYAIFAPDSIHNSWARLTTNPALGQLFAIVYTFGGNSGLSLGDPHHGGKYDKLGIAPGFNCLYLYRYKRDTKSEELRGRMIQYDTVSACAEAINLAHPDTTRPHTDLPVHRIKPAYKLGAVDVPAVARWDWSPTDSTQYVGVSCGPAWCEVGGQGSPSYAYASTLSHDKRRIAEIKGWYDEQFLDSGPADHPVPSHWGTIFPVSDLWSKDTSAFHDTWVPVAYVTVSADYNWALRFKHTVGAGPPKQTGVSGGVKTNIIEYCNGVLVTTPGAPGCYFDPSTGPTPTFAACPGPPTSTPPWWRRTLEPGTGNVIQTRCLKRWDHQAMGVTQINIPGTVRWRWAYGDMLSWGRCGGGCCQ